MIIKVKTLVFCENFMSTETFTKCCHMIKPEFTRYTLLFLVFAKTYIVGTCYEAFLTCTYNLNVLA